jgi:DNA-binding SARP family transcriptional activator/tetratricopeptide (TPR) repeat protein
MTPSSLPDVTIQLCGRFKVAVEGIERAATIGGQGRLVLAYLALNHAHAATRDRLIGALWSREAPPEYAQRLNVVLSKLRRALGPGVLEGTDVHGVQLVASARVDLDRTSAGLEEAVGAVERHDWHGALTVAGEVVDLAGRGLLPGYEAEWLEGPRRDLEEAGLKAGELIARAGVELGGTHLLSAERAAQAVLEVDPLRESASLLLMRVREAQGNTVDAERVYHDLRTLTLEQLGRGPGPAIKAEFERLLRAEPDNRPISAEAQRRGAGRAVGIRDPPQRSFFATRSGAAFVGRRAELERLYDYYARAAAGERQLVLLEGEPGIGKTRLALRLMSMCEDVGALAAYGRCDAETLIPYQPFVEALRHYVAHTSPHRRRAWADRYGDDVRILPELAKALGIPTPKPGREATERYLLFEAASEILAEVAEEQPVVFVVDDLHWAPKPTLLMLREMVRSTPQAPVLILGTYRGAERSADLVDTLVHLRRDHVLERVTLHGLNDDDAGELINRLCVRPLPSDLARAILEETEGSPFFLEEMLRHVERGVLTTESGAHEHHGQHALPESIREVIGQRLAAMSQQANEVLRTAAVIGREFSPELLEAIGRQTEERLDAVIEESIAAHVITDVPGGHPAYSFTHSLIRQTLYESIPGPRRARLHGQVGEALERLSAEANEQPLAELAYHFSLAPATRGSTNAVEYAQRAAEQALAVLAYEEAARLYGIALAALGDETAQLPRRCALLLRLGDARARAGEVQLARSSFNSAADAARRMHSPQQLARAALRYGTVGQMAGGVVDTSVVILVEEALDELGDGEPALRARLLARLAMELSFSEQRERRAALSEEALRIARSVGDIRGIGYALDARHWSLWGPANVDERLAAANELLELAEESGDERLAMQGHRWRMIDLLELCDMAEVDVEIDAYTALAEKRRRPSEAPYTRFLHAMRLLLTGDFDRAHDVGEEGRRLGERVQDSNAINAHVVQMLVSCRDRGGLDRVEEMVRRQTERFRNIPGWRCALAHVYAENGNHEDAHRILDGFGRGDFRDLPLDGLWLGAIAVLAETAATLGDPSHAERLHELLEPYAGRNVTIGWVSACHGSASRHLGLLKGLLGHREHAIAHFEKALETNTRMRARPLVARTRMDLARTLLERFEPSPSDVSWANAELDAALEEATALGMTRLGQECRELQRVRSKSTS